MTKNDYALNSLFHATGNSSFHYRILILCASYYHGKHHVTNHIASALFAVALDVAFLGVLFPAALYFDAVVAPADAVAPAGAVVPDVVVPDAVGPAAVAVAGAVVPDVVVPDAVAPAAAAVAGAVVPGAVVPDAVGPAAAVAAGAVVPDVSVSGILSLVAVLGFAAGYFPVQQLLKVLLNHLA